MQERWDEALTILTNATLQNVCDYHDSDNVCLGMQIKSKVYSV